MIIAPVIKTWFDAIICSLLALTALQRWEAAGRLHTNFVTTHLFIIISVIVLITLTVVFIVMSLGRTVREQKVDKQLFVEYAGKKGLSQREQQLLLNVANKAGIRSNEAIFTMSMAFDRGVAELIEESFAAQHTPEEHSRLKTELSFLREKLGFQKQITSSIGSPTKSKKLSSRQIPVGKKLYITRRRTRNTGDLESTVIRNNDVELTIELLVPLETAIGETWCVHYHFGASLWEFDTSVVSSDGKAIVLNHSDNVRFINRRRFLRVPVNKAAFIAIFPFVRTLVESSNDGLIPSDGNSVWEPPKFVPAVITELAGPGLRMETTLEIKVGNRVLVVVRLDDEKDKDSVSVTTEGKMTPSKIIEDIGEVRHVKAVPNGLSIAVELTGLSDSDLNELIRATNAASLKAGAEGQNVPLSADEESVPEPAAVQGV